ncbi:MAG: hypothetical protein ABI237_09185 [Ginsengibacter sp.]
MRKISVWAYHHKFLARIGIICIYILLNVLGLFTGDMFHSFGIVFNSLFLLITVTICIAGLIFYPSKKLKFTYKNYYLRQKSSDILLISATFLFIMYAGNSMNNRVKPLISSYAAVILNPNSKTKINDSSSDINTNAPSFSKKQQRKNFRTFVKQIRKKYKDSTKGQRTLYTILALIAAGGLIVLLGGLACSISCGGSEALAFIVFFTGLGGIIFGLVKLIQHINRGRPKKVETMAKQ